MCVQLLNPYVLRSPEGKVRLHNTSPRFKSGAFFIGLFDKIKVCYCRQMTCKAEEREACPLCEREILIQNLTKHHMVPKSCGGRETENLCRTCHRQLHALFTNRELDKELNSLEALKENSEIQTYLNWIENKNPDKYFRGDLPKERKRRK